jgi:hypothetical protein
VKDQFLKVVYRRGENGHLFVWLYRGGLHIGTITVNEFNVIKITRGVDNKASVLVKYLPEPLNVEA